MELIDTYQELNKLVDQSKVLLEQQADLYGSDLFIHQQIFQSQSKTAPVPPETLESLRTQVLTCKKCGLYASRKHVVFGEGPPDADVMLIGEAPGYEEDIQGKPFVGAAGQLLDKILAAIKFNRQDVFIANILKCHPPRNRDPLPEEVVQCNPYLWKQIEFIQPRIILALGRFAGQVLLGGTASLTQMRGKVHQKGHLKIIVTYHPAALLRHAEWKRPTWEDVKLLRRTFDELVGNHSTKL
jgi:uracil-DNA glycosylase family 4